NRRAGNGSSPVHHQSHRETYDRPLPGVESAADDSGRGGTGAQHCRADHASHAGLADRLSPNSIVRFKPKTKLRILVLLSQELMPPETIPEGMEKEKQPWRTEFDVISTLKSMGHEVYPVGLASDLAVIASAREQHKP